MSAGPVVKLTAPWSAEEDGTADVTVRPPCTCHARRWFECRCFEWEERYTGPGIDHTGAPRLEFLAALRDLYPGADMIYLRLPHVHTDRALG